MKPSILILFKAIFPTRMYWPFLARKPIHLYEYKSMKIILNVTAEKSRHFQTLTRFNLFPKVYELIHAYDHCFIKPQ